MLESATKVIAAAKACVKSGGIDPNKLRLYTDYVIARVGTVDIVYVGMTSNYTARKKAHDKAIRYQVLCDVDQVRDGIFYFGYFACAKSSGALVDIYIDERT